MRTRAGKGDQFRLMMSFGQEPARKMTKIMQLLTLPTPPPPTTTSLYSLNTARLSISRHHQSNLLMFGMNLIFSRNRGHGEGVVALLNTINNPTSHYREIVVFQCVVICLT